jgi:hypothetical protein
MALYGISESLQHSNIELPEETIQLCSSLHVGLRHAIALSCKACANAVLKRRDNVIAEAKSVIRLPQLTGALRSLGESFLFQDSLEEAIKIQTTLDPIPTKRASWPDKVKKKTTPQVQFTYSGWDYQGSSSRPKPRGNAPRNDGSGGLSAQGGQRGHIRPRGPLTNPLPLILPKEGGIASNSSVILQERWGGRLQGFAYFWDTWCPKDLPVPCIIRLGLRLDFVSQPPTTLVPSPVHLPQDSAKASALWAEVKSLQDNGVIFHINNPGSGFYSHIFVVPKKQKGSWRLIIDLSRLSRFLRVPHFKMETTRSVAAAILPGDWAVYHWTYGTRIITSPYIQITSIIFDFTSKVEYTSSRLCLSDWLPRLAKILKNTLPIPLNALVVSHLVKACRARSASQ